MSSSISLGFKYLMDKQRKIYEAKGLYPDEGFLFYGLFGLDHNTIKEALQLEYDEGYKKGKEDCEYTTNVTKPL